MHSLPFRWFCLNAESVSWRIWTRGGGGWCPLGLPPCNIDPRPNFVLRLCNALRHAGHLEPNRKHRSAPFPNSWRRFRITRIRNCFGEAFRGPVLQYTHQKGQILPFINIKRNESMFWKNFRFLSFDVFWNCYRVGTETLLRVNS